MEQVERTLKSYPVILLGQMRHPTPLLEVEVIFSRGQPSLIFKLVSKLDLKVHRELFVTITLVGFTHHLLACLAFLGKERSYLEPALADLLREDVPRVYAIEVVVAINQVAIYTEITSHLGPYHQRGWIMNAKQGSTRSLCEVDPKSRTIFS